MPSGARAGPSSDPEREKAKKREAKKSQTQKLYELLVPKSSTGEVGRFGECRWGTMPYLKTLIRMEEYDRSLTRTQQLHRDTQLAKPKNRKEVVGASRTNGLPAGALLTTATLENEGSGACM